MESILYIFLPCKKVYPIGVTYLADFIHRRKPEVRQRILDLSLFSESQRSQAIRDVDLRTPLRAGATETDLAAIIRHRWEPRDDRGAETRLAMIDRSVFAPPEELRRRAHLEMHKRGG